MSYLPEPKDPDEKITIGFDYSHVTPTPSNPSFEVALRWGSESPVTLVVEGNPNIDGDKVYQRFVGGADMNDYNVKCFCDTPSGDRIAVDCVLAVRTRPV